MTGVSYTDLTLYRRLLSQARPYWPHILLLLLVSLLSSPLTLLAPLPLKIVVDSVLGADPLPSFLEGALPAVIIGSDAALLLFAAVFFVVVALLRQLQELGSSLVRTYTGEKLVLGFRARLFSHVQRLSLSYHDAQGTADATYRIQYDAQAIQSIAVDGVIPFLTAALTLGSMLYVVTMLDSQLCLVALAISPVLLVLTASYRRRLRRQAREVKRLESSAMTVVQEVLGALRVVKAFSREEREQERFVGRASEGMRRRIGLALTEGAYALLVGLCIAAGTATVLYIGARHVQTGALSLGELLLVMGYLSQLYDPLKTMSKRTVALQSALASAERAFALLDRAPDVPERPAARPLRRASGAVCFRSVCFEYLPGQRVLDDVSFDFSPGTRVGVLGATGAGKTTLVSLLTRFYDPAAGAILLDGIDLRDYKLADLRTQFSIVLQDTVLFSTTVAENIAYARPEASFEEIVAAARAASAHEFISALPEAYDTLVGERGMRLSGGERQRIALARAFLRDAPIVLLDEPTSAIDLETEAAIMEALPRLTKGKTTFLIAHRLSTLQHCDLWLELEGGRLVRAASSPPPQVREAAASRMRAAADGARSGSSERRRLKDLGERATSVRVRSSALHAGTKGKAAQEARQPTAAGLAPSRGSRGRSGNVIPTVAAREVLEHPATRAWARLAGRRMPERIEGLQETKKSLVLRLRNAAPGGGDVIAKRRRGEALRLEGEIYGSVLPHLPVSAPGCYGLVEDGDGVHGWLFLEDAGEAAYSPRNRQHRLLAARWLALLHASAHQLAAAAALPDRGAAHYLDHLRSARDGMLGGQDNPALRPEDVVVLDDLIAQCALVESRWDELEKLSQGLPQTLVHGDFVPKNVRVRRGVDGPILLPFDWELAGWGVPAADLAETAPILYWQFMSEHWRSFDLAVVTRVAKVGRLFRTLAAIHWASRWLAYPWIEKPMADLRLYRRRLADVRQLLDRER